MDSSEKFALAGILGHVRRRLSGDSIARSVLERRSIDESWSWKSAEHLGEWLELASALHQAGRLSDEEYLLYRIFPAERLHSARWFDGSYPELDEIDEQMAALERSFGLQSDHMFARHAAPAEWLALDDKYNAALEHRFVETLRELGLDQEAKLRGENPKLFDFRREQARRFIFEPENSLSALIATIDTYEREASVCIAGGARYAACVMLGSATEARILVKCLTEPAQAERARRAASGNITKKDPLRWTLDELIKVAQTAGWISIIEDDEVGVSVELWLTSLRQTRNLLHPGCHIREMPHLSIGEEALADAVSAYAALCHLLGELPIVPKFPAISLSPPLA